MEKDFYHSEFEDLIREKAEQYKMYPSEKVWKGIDRSLRARKRWYWTGFVLLLSGVSYFAVTELMSPSSKLSQAVTSRETTGPVVQVSPAQLAPFSTLIGDEFTPPLPLNDIITSELFIEDSGDITAAFEIPLNLIPGNNAKGNQQKAAFMITGLEPLNNHETYNIELSWPLKDADHDIASSQPQAGGQKLNLPRNTAQPTSLTHEINWFEDMANIRLPAAPKRISWQLAFSPTINYRKLTGNSNSRGLSRNQGVPMAIRIEGDIDKLVNHKPALGFELGTHGLLRLSKRVSLKGGIQFNYSKYDIRAFRTQQEQATIALNSRLGNTPGAIVNYTDLRNFGGSSVQDLKNQYFQLSMPVGFELRVFGNEKLAFNLASTIQPTYLINRNTYLITTDLKNYTKEPSLVRRWNVNTGAEAYISYTRGDVKWQVGPQFRYQLLSSYQNVYPIKEYLMEYGIKVGITKTIR